MVRVLLFAFSLSMNGIELMSAWVPFIEHVVMAFGITM